jgi:cell division protein FtsW
MNTARRVDKPLVIATVLLLLAGLFIFSSAALGIFASEETNFAVVVGKQLIIALVGVIAMYVVSRIPYRLWRKYALVLFAITIVATAAVFIPGLGFSHGGATRWISLGFTTIQPSEFLKIAAIIYFAGWCAIVRDKIKTVKYGLLPLGIIAGICGLILLLQPDTDTFMVMMCALVAIFIAAGGRWWHLGIVMLIGMVAAAALIYTRPYLMSRFTVFLDPSRDAQGAGYQIQQSLIAIGNGGITGRGFGQSIQKFSFLPEPIGDSIFAVFAEEFGLIGSLALIILFVMFGSRALVVAGRAPDQFGRLTIVGLAILIISQAFVNIGAMLGVLPLTGITLPFVSHGGTALLSTLAATGIMLNISRHTSHS